MSLRILIVCTGDTAKEPRVLMELDALAHENEIFLASSEFSSVLPRNVTLIRLGNDSNRDDRLMRGVARRVVRSIRRLESAIARRVQSDRLWYHYVCSMVNTEWLALLQSVKPDLIIAHHVSVLPLAFRTAQRDNVPVILNAHEYYPRQFDGNLWWERNIKPETEFLCRTFLARCDAVMAVSPGIVAEYRRVYGVTPTLIMSTKPFAKLSPSPVVPGRIRLIHHGIANPDRQIELMIDLVMLLDERFSIDFMLVPSPAHKEYYSDLRSRIERTPRVRFVDPVPTREIAERINEYDMGLYLLVPKSFNLEHCLPNKLFEFMQARLGVAFTPVVDAAALIKARQIGIISNDFSVKAMADSLNALSADDVIEFKKHSHIAAEELSSQRTNADLRAIVQRVMSNRRNGTNATSLRETPA